MEIQQSSLTATNRRT